MWASVGTGARQGGLAPRGRSAAWAPDARGRRVGRVGSVEAWRGRVRRGVRRSGVAILPASEYSADGALYSTTHGLA